MKRLTTLMIATLIATAAFAQSKNPTNKKEIDDKVKQAAMVPTYVKSLVDFVQKGVANDTKVFGQQMYAVFKTNKYDAMAIDQIFTDKFKKK